MVWLKHLGISTTQGEKNRRKVWVIFCGEKNPLQNELDVRYIMHLMYKFENMYLLKHKCQFLNYCWLV